MIKSEPYTMKEKIDNIGGTRQIHIPLELINEILLRLPATSLARFKFVSPSWRRLINDPAFIRLHLLCRTNPDTYLIESKNAQYLQRLHTLTLTYHNKSHNNNNNYQFHLTEYAHPSTVFNDSFKEVIGSCNGLLCFRTSEIDPGFALYNPVTRDLRRLPPLDTAKTRGGMADMAPRMAAFGYDRISHDYKVLTHFQKDNEQSCAMIYSLKTDAWHDIPNGPVLEFVSGPHTRPVLANNTFYWMQAFRGWIMCFDLLTHHYYNVPRPHLDDNHQDDHSELAILRGQLCAVTINKHKHNLDIQKFDKQWQGWFRIFRYQSGLLLNNVDIISWSEFIPPSFVSLKDGQRILFILICWCDLESNEVKVCWCDLESNEVVKDIEGPSLDELKSIINVHPWVDSLVPLH